MKTVKFVVVFFMTVLCIASCRSRANKGNTIEIGAVIPLTGNYSDVGDWMKVGMEMAVEDFNSESDKYQLSLLYEDSQSSATSAISAYQKLKSTKKVKFFVSTVSSVCLALKPLAGKDSRLLFVNAGHKDLVTDDNPFVFRHALTIPQEASFIADQLQIDSTIVEDTKVALLYTNNEIGTEFKDVFIEKYASYSPITNVVSYEESETSLKSIVLKLLSQSPQVIVIYGYTKNFGQVITTIREQGFSGKIYANQGFSTPTAIENAGVSGNNVFYSDYDFPENERMDDLRFRVKEKYGQDLSSMNITSYNIISLIGSAIAAVGPNVKEVISYLNGNGPYDINGMQITVEKGEVYVPLKLVENHYNQ